MHAYGCLHGVAGRALAILLSKVFILSFVTFANEETKKMRGQ